MTRGLARILVVILLAGCARREVSHDRRADLVAGWEYYRLGEYQQALLRFERVAATLNEPARYEALYAAATTWNLRRPDEDVAKARALYEQIIREAPQSDWAAWSALALARLTHLVPADQTPDDAAVQRAYQGVRDNYPGHPAAWEALWFQQSARLRHWQPDLARAAVAELEQSLRDNPDSPYREGVYGLLANGYEILRQPVAQLAMLERSLPPPSTDPANPRPDVSGTYWRIAAVAEFDAADWPLARKYYQMLIAEYPRDARVFMAKQALARMDAHEAQWRGTP